ncbi:uncharacterized protein THITE_2108573 [Thermothielavioides terrestris NRRL 8126]|uniref:CTLH domain-containing protein n=1 Tax=Thermothielavioides terrestris (strain ATCC 38088 / NRRL 8126) TaxID=578455 RepID=G2QRP4_THETT|nr:uncharacterized protein THITE_2108573 [Thermothielavioides terrestris NRRL 8126]AEO63391.1 hypothetical protein THITE_2108573 [Thermothielavioides terrestris NRRL 8126]
MLTEIDNGGPSTRAARVVSNRPRAAGANGGPVAGQREDYLGHDREQITRILIQALNELGYHAAAESVAEESGFQVESPDVVAFRHAVLGGDWVKAEQLLSRDSGRRPGQGSGDGLVLAPGADRNAMRFQIRQQKFLELLERRETSQALTVLRNELSPLCSDQHQTLHLLSRFLMCQDAEDLRSRANWDGADGRSRQLLLERLSESISPEVMLPDHRLAALLHDVKRSQVDRCLYHTTEEPPSLYTDHSCDRSRFPSEVLVELCSPRIEASKRPEEIWQVCFSPDGRRLASCGTDEAVSVWDVEHLTLLHELRGHPGGIGSVAWSPDSKLLVSCGKNHVAKVWHVDTGECVSTLSGFEEPISSCVWPADGRTFVLGSFDKKQSLCLWNMAEECVYSFAKTHRTEDVALSPDQRWLVAMDERCNLHVYNFGTRELVYDLALNSRATCVSISRDSKYMLVNKSDNEALLIDIETRETVQRYTGQTGGQFTIRSGFGGANENFVISGSEDGRVFIWHKMKGILVHEAEAHHPSCNTVSWNPCDPCMFATAGDDGRIKM